MREKIQKLIQKLRGTNDHKEQDKIKEEIDLLEEKMYSEL